MASLLERLQQHGIILPSDVTPRLLPVFSAEALSHIWQIKQNVTLDVPFRQELVARILRFWFDSGVMSVPQDQARQFTTIFVAFWQRLEYLTPVDIDLLPAAMVHHPALMGVLTRARLNAAAAAVQNFRSPQPVIALDEEEEEERGAHPSAAPQAPHGQLEDEAE